MTTTTTRKSTAVRVATKRATAVKAPRVATKSTAAKPAPKAAVRTATKPTAVAPVKVPRTATKPATKVAVKPAPVKVAKPKAAKVAQTSKSKATKAVQPTSEKFSFYVDGEFAETLPFATLEGAQEYAETQFIEPRKGWTVTWKGNRAGYTPQVTNSRGNPVESNVRVSRGEHKDKAAPREVLGLDEYGFRNGSDSSIAAHALIEGGASRSEINEKVRERIAATNGLKTRGGKEKVIATIVGNTFMALVNKKGYSVESSWQMVPPTK